MRISEYEAQLATLVAQEEEAEAKLRAHMQAATEQIDACFPMWASWQTLARQRRKLEETLAESLQSIKRTQAETRGDVMAEVEFLARFSEDITTGDDENVLVPRWLLKKVHQDVQSLV